MKKLFIICALVLLFPIHAIAAPLKPTDKELTVLNNYVYEQLYATLAIPSYFPPPTIIPLYHKQMAMRDDANIMARKFNDNQLQAEQTYKDKIIGLTGDIVEIQRDVLGNPYISLYAPDAANSKVVAYLERSEVERAATYKKGQYVILSCQSIRKAPYIELQSCFDADNRAETLAKEVVSQFLNGKDISKMVRVKALQSPSLFFFNLIYALHSSELDEDCLIKGYAQECPAFNNMPEKFINTSEYKKAYAENKEFYHLP